MNTFKLLSLGVVAMLIVLAILCFFIDRTKDVEKIHIYYGFGTVIIVVLAASGFMIVNDDEKILAIAFPILASVVGYVLGSSSSRVGQSNATKINTEQDASKNESKIE